MSLPRDVYWGIEDEKGQLSRIWGYYGWEARLFLTRRQAKERGSLTGERPVKVKIVRVK